MNRIYSICLLGLIWFGSLFFGCDDSPTSTTTLPEDTTEHIVFIRPVANTTYRVGDTVPLEWEYKNPAQEEWFRTTLRYSLDNELTFQNLQTASITHQYPSDTLYWIIPDTSFISETVHFEAHHYTRFTTKGTSEKITIVP
ncbi:hypothetical protein ACFL5V_05150 [Fibrobacterota bacterium]